MANVNLHVRRIESVESEVRRLQEQLEEMKQMISARSQQALSGSGVDAGLSVSVQQPSVSPPQVVGDGAGFLAPDMRVPAVQRLQDLQGDVYRPPKRRRTGFEVREEPISDFISKGLITMDYAVECFTTCVILSSL